ncbi:MAG: Wzz/FepE/Etk N-terminal domain-containing protein [Sedimenticola sp.]|nr:Wzz/FepE/Etk N-terminal domain-containing protein [Sedimenticola sp.]
MNNKENKVYGEGDLIEDEISLGKLIKLLWSHKNTIFAVILLCTVSATVYLFFATPIYQAQSVLRLAPVKAFDALNGTGLYDLNPEQALQRVGAALESHDLRLKFYRANQKLFGSINDEQNGMERKFEAFSKVAFKILQPDHKKELGLSPYIGIQLTYPEGVDGAAIVNGLVEAAIRTEREIISSDFKVFIKNRLSRLELKTIAMRAKYEAEKEARIANLLEADSLKKMTLQDELKALREKIKTERMNRIEKLNEAIAIATTLGIEKPTTPSALSDNGKVLQGNSFKAEVNNQTIPLYFFGSKVLETERDVLLNRRSDDFAEPRIPEIQKELRLLEHNRSIETLNQRENDLLFFEGQATLHEETARLRNLNIDLAKMKLVVVDQPAVEPVEPMKPRKSLLLILSFVFGLFLSFLVVLMRNQKEDS